MTDDDPPRGAGDQAPGPPESTAPAVAITKALTWIITSAGLTGLLYTAGYVIEASTENFLGIATTPAGKTDYLQAAGDFAFSIGQSAWLFLAADLFSIATLPWFWVASLMVFGIAWLARRYRVATRLQERGRRRPQHVWVAAAVAAALLSTAKMAMVDWPVIPIREVLLREVGLAPSKPVPFDSVTLPWLARRTDAIWKDIFCARYQPAEPRSTCEDAESHRQSLRFLFLGDVLYAGSLLVTTGVLLWTAGRIVSWTIPTALLAMLLGIVTVTNVASLFHVYAKTVRGTDRKQIILHRETGGFVSGTLERSSSSVVRLVAEGVPRWHWEIPRAHVRALAFDLNGPKPQVNVQYDSGKAYDEVHGWLLVEAEKTITLYEQKERQVWEVPRDRIRVVKVEGLSDVLLNHFKNTYERP